VPCSAGRSDAEGQFQPGATAIVGLFAHDVGKNGGKAPAIDDRGKLAERLEVRIRPFPLCIA
jgi:hypothetical protein